MSPHIFLTSKRSLIHCSHWSSSYNFWPHWSDSWWSTRRFWQICDLHHKSHKSLYRARVGNLLVDDSLILQAHLTALMTILFCKPISPPTSTIKYTNLTLIICNFVEIVPLLNLAEVDVLSITEEDSRNNCLLSSLPLPHDREDLSRFNAKSVEKLVILLLIVANCMIKPHIITFMLTLLNSLLQLAKLVNHIFCAQSIIFDPL